MDGSHHRACEEPHISGYASNLVPGATVVRTLGDGLRKGYYESRRCSRDTYPEPHITKYTCVRRLVVDELVRLRWEPQLRSDSGFEDEG